MNCEQWRSDFWARADRGETGAAGAETGAEAGEAHLRECAACRRLARAWAGVDEALAGRADEVDLPEGFAAGVLARCAGTAAPLDPARLKERRAELELERDRLLGRGADRWRRWRWRILGRVLVVTLISLAGGGLVAAAVLGLALAAEAVPSSVVWTFPAALALVLVLFGGRRWRGRSRRAGGFR